jgi:hypothetical protein
MSPFLFISHSLSSCSLSALSRTPSLCLLTSCLFLSSRSHSFSRLVLSSSLSPTLSLLSYHSPLVLSHHYTVALSFSSLFSLFPSIPTSPFPCSSLPFHVSFTSFPFYITFAFSFHYLALYLIISQSPLTIFCSQSISFQSQHSRSL